MAIILGKETKLTEAQQKEIIERCSEAYDKGGSDVLALLIETVKQIAEDQPDLKSYCGFTIHVIEAVRQRLKEAVDDQVHDQIPQESKIITA